MRVVMVSKALVVSAYRRKLEELARLPGIELTAIVPPGWRGRYDSASLERLPPDGPDGYELLVEPIVFNGQHHLHFYPRLGRLLRRIRPDILHMDEEPYNFATWHALRAGEAVHARGLFFTWQNLPRRYPWPFRHFERANYGRAAHAIAGSEAAASVLRAKGYDGPLTVIPQFGIEPAVFRPASGRRAIDSRAEKEAALAAGRGFVIGYAGRLVPEKGVDVLLRACAALPSHNWTVHIMGDGPERARLAALAESLGIAGQTTFLGRLPSDQAPDFYHALDALVLPSLTRPNWVEQFGRVLVEAMACEVPVIGSSSGEIPAVIGDAGLVCPEGDVSALAASIAFLEGKPEQRAELARRGRSRVLARFTHAQIASESLRVYRQMLGENGQLAEAQDRVTGFTDSKI
jgi:glycosyltransferase involved in cell wall biosynthesis